VVVVVAAGSESGRPAGRVQMKLVLVTSESTSQLEVERQASAPRVRVAASASGNLNLRANFKLQLCVEADQTEAGGELVISESELVKLEDNTPVFVSSLGLF
jgi:hypothetical protein